ncbi:Uncharacterised protein [Mycobacterium tuberculosis]|nr:Uncharacterised protein [Mycobacterium tuberculosis]
MPHSVGVRCTSAPSLMTFLPARSTVNESVSITGCSNSAAAVLRRTAARSRARNSSIPNGFVT